MAVAKVELPNGAKVEIDGTIGEIAQFMQFYTGQAAPPASGEEVPPPRTFAPSKPRRRVAVRTAAARAEGDEEGATVDVARIAEIIKDCDEAEVIEEKILNQRNVLNRVLLPLWITAKHIDENLGLTSGDASKVTDQLGVKVSVPSASKTLSDQAKAYVTADSVRKKGAVVRYRLNRRGHQYFEGLLK